MPIPVGLQVHQSLPGTDSEVALLQNMLPLGVLELLNERLDHIPVEHQGANSFFIPFVSGDGGQKDPGDPQKDPDRDPGDPDRDPVHIYSHNNRKSQNAIESVILNMFVPKLFGSMVSVCVCV